MQQQIIVKEAEVMAMREDVLDHVMSGCTVSPYFVFESMMVLLSTGDVSSTELCTASKSSFS
jgi:hypothetical protein